MHTSEGGMIRLETLKPSSSSSFSVRVFRAYPLVEIRQTVPCQAIRGSSISVRPDSRLTFPESLVGKHRSRF